MSKKILILLSFTVLFFVAQTSAEESSSSEEVVRLERKCTIGPCPTPRWTPWWTRRTKTPSTRRPWRTTRRTRSTRRTTTPRTRRPLFTWRPTYSDPLYRKNAVNQQNYTMEELLKLTGSVIRAMMDQLGIQPRSDLRYRKNAVNQQVETLEEIQKRTGIDIKVIVDAMMALLKHFDIQPTA